MHRNLASISVTHSFSVISANIAINNISLKTTFFGLHFRRIYVIRPNSMKLRRG